MKAIISSILLLCAAYQSIRLTDTNPSSPRLSRHLSNKIKLDPELSLRSSTTNFDYTNSSRKLFIPEPWENIPMGLIQGALTGRIAGKWMANKKSFIAGEERRHFKNSYSFLYESELANNRLKAAKDNVEDLSGPLSKLQAMADSLLKLSKSDLVDKISSNEKPSL